MVYATEELKLLFHFISINFNLNVNSCICLVATILDDAALEFLPELCFTWAVVNNIFPL